MLTGASGLIGLQLAPALCAAGFEVHATSRRRPIVLPPQAVWHQCDLMNDRATAELCAETRATHLMHGAWCVDPGTVWWSGENVDWCAATLRLVRAFTAAGGRRAVVVGTCAEYDWSAGACDEAVTPLRPATLYGQAKDSCRAVLERYAGHGELSLAWARLFNMYGPHENPQRLVAAAITTLLRGERFSCTDGSQRRNFLHVTDVAEALTAVLTSTLEGAVNIGSETSVTIHELLEEVGRQMGASNQIGFGDKLRSASEPWELIPVLDRLRASVSWRPRYTMQERVGQTIGWWRSEMWLSHILKGGGGERRQ